MAIHTVEVHGLTFEVEGQYVPGDPGKYSGPPENCYPAEPSEFDTQSTVFISDSGERFPIPWEVLDNMVFLESRESKFVRTAQEEITEAALEAHEHWLHSLPDEPF